MKVTGVYSMALFVATAFLFVAPPETAASVPVEAELPPSVSKRDTVLPLGAPTLLARRYRSFSSRSVRDWGARSVVQQRFQKRDTRLLKFVPT
ncbi:hypothetical protein H4R33_007064, partial [Dimargaris cristalligena]